MGNGGEKPSKDVRSFFLYGVWELLHGFPRLTALLHREQKAAAAAAAGAVAAAGAAAALETTVGRRLRWRGYRANHSVTTLEPPLLL